MTLLIGMLMVLFALLMLGAAAWLYVSAEHAQLQEQVEAHFSKILPRGTTISGVPGKPKSKFHFWRARASIYLGFELQGWHVLALFIGIVLMIGAGYRLVGWGGTSGILLLLILAFGFLLPYTRLKKKQQLTISQIPMFVDQVMRSLGTGRSIESAIRNSADDMPAPLQPILQRVVRAADLGADMAETLSEAAELHELRELNLIALAIRMSSIYGSSPKEMLQSVVQMIRHQEAAHRELAALTGETRISAWVLGLTPIVIAAYIMLVNPSYLDTMLRDPSGRSVLYVAIGMQGIGVFVIWRMLRSV